MNGALRFLFALLLAVTMVVSPLASARAASCVLEAIAGSATHAPHAMGGSHRADADHVGERADHGRVHCEAARLCCTTACAAPLLSPLGTETVGTTVSAVLPLPPDLPLPDGIASVPPFDPPRSTV